VSFGKAPVIVARQTINRFEVILGGTGLLEHSQR
jgi:hypothetical protein